MRPFSVPATIPASRARHNWLTQFMASQTRCATTSTFVQARRSLYFTPALTTTINLQDGSLVVIPELAYSPMTNLDIRFRTPVLIGKKGTEYGEKQNDYRVELRIRYYFGL